MQRKTYDENAVLNIIISPVNAKQPLNFYMNIF